MTISFSKKGGAAPAKGKGRAPAPRAAKGKAAAKTKGQRLKPAAVGKGGKKPRGKGRK